MRAARFCCCADAWTKATMASAQSLNTGLGGQGMTIEQKDQIRVLRGNGRTYAQIARALSVPEGTVKTFCNRNKVAANSPAKESSPACAYCGAPIVQPEHRKQKRFCSDKCRMRWWNQNRAQIATGSKLEKTCPVCHTAFFCYDKGRKYCSHSCYVQARFGGTQDVNAST